MRERAPFRADDLEELDERFLARAARVVAMEDVVAGERAPNVIGLRHDCDAGHSLATAVNIARWEAERGYRSTFYILHTSPYWGFPHFREMLDEIAGYGHEIGIHTDALAEALKTGRDPGLILDEALATLRGFGFPVRGVAGHGNPMCNRDRAPGEITFANDEQFLECRRVKEGPADRLITRGNISLRLAPRPLADFGLEYEALWSAYPFPWRISDSGGKWLNPGFDETAEQFARQLDVTDLPTATEAPRQLHFLWHPDWWGSCWAETRRAIAA